MKDTTRISYDRSMESESHETIEVSCDMARGGGERYVLTITDASNKRHNIFLTGKEFDEINEIINTFRRMQQHV